MLNCLGGMEAANEGSEDRACIQRDNTLLTMFAGNCVGQRFSASKNKGRRSRFHVRRQVSE